MNLNYDFFSQTYEQTDDYFCGLHGRARVDPDGEQMNLDRRGGCGFHLRNEPIDDFTDLSRDFKALTTLGSTRPYTAPPYDPMYPQVTYDTNTKEIKD